MVGREHNRYLKGTGTRHLQVPERYGHKTQCRGIEPRTCYLWGATWIACPTITYHLQLELQFALFSLWSFRLVLFFSPFPPPVFLAHSEPKLANEQTSNQHAMS